MQCKGYMIRKVNWHKLEKDYPEQFLNIKMKNFCFYINKIKSLISLAKERDVKIFNVRSDYNQIIYLDEKNIRKTYSVIAKQLKESWSNPDYTVLSGNHTSRSEQKMLSYEQQV